jgi:hypothetical protein
MPDKAMHHWAKREKRLIFWLAVCLISVLLVYLSNALEREMARAEEAMFKTVLAEINAMLIVKTAEKISQNKKGDVKNFVNHNPMNWMKTTPVNYSGIVEGRTFDEEFTDVTPGHWFFSRTEKAIVYRVINTGMVEIKGTDKPEFIGFRVVLDYIDNNQNAQFDEHKERLIGLKLQPLQEYKWRAINPT